MRILFVNHTGLIGGAEHSLLELTNLLPQHGVTPIVAAPAGPLTERLQAAAVEVHPLPLHNLLRPRNPLAALRTLWQIRQDAQQLSRLIRRLCPDLIHANSAKAAFAATLAARRCNIPALWHCRDLAPAGARWLLRRAPAIAISQAVYDSLPDAPQHIYLVRNGIDLTRFDPARHERAACRHQLDLPADVPLVAMVADLVPWKGHHLLLEVAARMLLQRHDIHFVIAGSSRPEDPQLAPYLKQRATELGIGENLIWLGHCPDTAPLYVAADLLLHPATREPFGRVVCEALAMNCPVVVADAAGPAEIAREASPSAVRLAVPDSADSFATAALDLLDTDPPGRLPTRADMRLAFNIERTAGQMVKLYHTFSVAQQ